MTTFAVAVPNFNQSRFLPSALESLRHQPVPFKLAVMDGGSTDHFPAVVAPYADIITFSRSAPDDGQTAAIREGLERIPGDIVSWLNADDYYFPGALERVAACFAADPGLDVVYGDAVHVTEAGFFLSYFPPIQEFNAEDLTRTCFICQPACFVRRTAYEKVGGVDPALVYTMDWDLWCRLARAGAKFRYLPGVLAAVRYYQGTKTLSGSRRRYLEIWRIEREYGGRLLPRSWVGFYLYDLMCKSTRTRKDAILLTGLKRLRSVKTCLFRSETSKRHSRKTLYGFHRWEPIVEGTGIVHLPWYDQRSWKKINLRVEPENETFEITINDFPVVTAQAVGGQVSISVPRLGDPYRSITIASRDQRPWKLLDFRCELH